MVTASQHPGSESLGPGHYSLAACKDAEHVHSSM